MIHFTKFNLLYDVTPYMNDITFSYAVDFKMEPSVGDDPTT